jgi:hypothetical protein
MEGRTRHPGWHSLNHLDGKEFVMIVELGYATEQTKTFAPVEVIDNAGVLAKAGT